MQNQGLHIVATIVTNEIQKLNNFDLFKQMVEGLIPQFSLQKLGEVYHNFSPHGFTAVICLSESHISVHTWPEHQLVNYDIYLSNHLQNNRDKVIVIHQAFELFFNGETTQCQYLNR